MSPKKEPATGVHRHVLDRYASGDGVPDGDSVSVAGSASGDFLIIGPCTGVGGHCSENPDQKTRRAFMQGGFLPYSAYSPSVRLPQFEGKESVQTFNLNGNVSAAEGFIAAEFSDRKWAGKNVCHTVWLDKNRLDMMGKNDHPLAELFCEAGSFYLSRHEGKKFHDPVAAVLTQKPELGVWVKGRPMRVGGGWTTDLSGGDDVLADLDRDGFWEYLASWGR